MAAVVVPEESLADKKIRLEALNQKVVDLQAQYRLFRNAWGVLRQEIDDMEKQMAVTLF